MEPNQLIERAESCHQEIALEYFNAFSGQKERLEAAAIYGRYPELFSRSTLDSVSQADFGAGLSERELRFTRRMFTFNHISDRLKAQREELANAEGEFSVDFEGQSVPYRSAPLVVSTERDYDRRGRFDAIYMQAMDSFNPAYRALGSARLSAIRELGYSGVIDICEQLKGLRIYPMRDMLKNFLDETESTFPARLAEQADSAGMEGRPLRHADISFILSAPQYDSLFPAEGLVSALARSLSGLGIDLETQQGVTLDLESRPLKSPRAFCVGINPPHDVRLVLKPRGGQDDYSTLLHEAGHLQFGAHMAPELSFLYRQQGDTSVHESYAFLLQHLVEDPIWWQEVMGIRPDANSGSEQERLAAGFIRFARFHRFYFLRRYGAKLNYEVEFHENSGSATDEEQAARYVKWLTRGLTIPYPAERYLQDFDDYFYVLEYLQAWIWEVQLRAHLKREFGEAWFLNMAAGDFLRELWREGMKYDVWELAERLGYSGLDIAPLKAELEA